jgi:hypothetical protein
MSVKSRFSYDTPLTGIRLIMAFPFVGNDAQVRSCEACGVLGLLVWFSFSYYYTLLLSV